jgi:Fe-S cluster assembly protein SufD
MKAEPYLQALAGFPAGERAQREARLQRFLAHGFPGKRLEDWKYTDLAPLAELEFVPANDDAEVPDLSAHFIEGCDRVVFVNGHLRSGPPALHARPLPAPQDERGGVSALTTALSTGGLYLRLAKNQQLPRPLHVLLVTVPGSAHGMSHLSHSIQLEPGAQATVILHHVGVGDSGHFVTHDVHLRAMDDARLDLVRIQEEGAGTYHLFRADAQSERGARMNLCTVDLGGGLVRNDWNVNLAAPGAAVELNGLYAPTGRAHVDNHTRIDHYFPHGTSRESFRGVVGEQARAVFNGKIVVHPNAQKTDSEQHVANLLLGKGAEVNAKPELEIYADDVKCAHGATFGQLDDTAIFYLRSRGIDQATARSMLTYTFAFDVLGRIAHAGARQLAERRFAARLPHGLDLDGLL